MTPSTDAAKPPTPVQRRVFSRAQIIAVPSDGTVRRCERAIGDLRHSAHEVGIVRQNKKPAAIAVPS